MTEFFAHSANEDGHRHGLVEHLRAVAELAVFAWVAAGQWVRGAG